MHPRLREKSSATRQRPASCQSRDPATAKAWVVRVAHAAAECHAGEGKDLLAVNVMIAAQAAGLGAEQQVAKIGVLILKTVATHRACPGALGELALIFHARAIEQRLALKRTIDEDTEKIAAALGN